MISFQIPGALRAFALAAILALPACKDGSTNQETPGAASPGTDAPAKVADLSGPLKKIAEDHAREGRGFIVSLRLDNGQEWIETAGTRSEEGPTTTGEEHFEIGSITKLFTAVSVLQLFETGALDLNAPLTDYFDSELLGVLVGGEKGDVPALKVRHLLNHSTGMGDYINIAQKNMPGMFLRQGPQSLYLQ